MTIRALIVVASVIAAVFNSASPAQADAKWRVEPGPSSISFRYSVDGEEQHGKFVAFSGEGSFAAQQPQDAQLSLNIDVDSIDLDDALRTELVKTDAWFGARQHPNATFQLTNLTAVSDARFEAIGILTIKEIEQSIEMPISLQIENGRARAVGEVVFARSDFEIGDRLGAMFFDIGDDIAVVFDISAIECRGDGAAGC